VKDQPLKEMMFKHYWAQRCFVQPEVDVHSSRGTSKSSKLITDVDVLIFRPHSDFYFEKILGDCKTLKGQSPIGRALWLRGLMEFVDSKRGLIVLRTNRIESDHKIASNQVNVRLFSEEEFKVYDKSVVYPEGSSKIPISLQDIETLKNLPKRFPYLSELVTYLYRDALLECHSGRLMRRVIGHIRSLSGEFDPEKIEHLALMCDAAAIFSIGVAQCTGEIFNQYLQPNEKEVLSESLKVLVWGGREQYESIQILRKKVLGINGAQAKMELDPLILPEWNQFVQLIRHTLDRPSASFYLPWILRCFTFDLLRGNEPLKHARFHDLLLLKYAMLTLDYLCRASGIPKQFKDFFESKLVDVQSRLANKHGLESKEVQFFQAGIQKEKEPDKEGNLKLFSD
jgi:hypothetical protein